MNFNLYQEQKKQYNKYGVLKYILKVILLIALGLLSFNLFLNIKLARLKKEEELLSQEIAKIDCSLLELEDYDSDFVDENEAYLYESMLYDLEQINDSKPKNLSLTQVRGSINDDLTIIGDFKTLADYEEFISNLEERGYIVLNSYSEKIGYMSNKFHLQLQF